MVIIMGNGKVKKKQLREYLWIVSSLYLVLSLYNLMFAWLGMICFLTPLTISFMKGSKLYCNKYCGRGQLLDLLGNKLKLSRNKPMPKWMKSSQFRYSFLAFFFMMFFSMLGNTYMVLEGTKSLREVITILWTFQLPWNFVSYSNFSPWMVQFGFGFYSVMLTSSILGLGTMVMYKPRSWCVYCPMGTMTQGICKVQQRIEKAGKWNREIE